MVTALIAMFIFLCVWAMYTMGVAWWNEIWPQTECQRIARIAVATAKEGTFDATAGTDTINFVTYRKRNGLEEAMRTRADSLTAGFVTPTITLNGRRINYKLEPDATATNNRAFYLGQDGSGVKALYYQNGNNVQEIRSTRVNATSAGNDLDIFFEPVAGTTNIIKMTVTVQRRVIGSRSAPYNISVVYSDYIYLRNV